MNSKCEEGTKYERPYLLTTYQQHIRDARACHYQVSLCSGLHTLFCSVTDPTARRFAARCCKCCFHLQRGRNSCRCTQFYTQTEPPRSLQWGAIAQAAAGTASGRWLRFDALCEENAASRIVLCCELDAPKQKVGRRRNRPFAASTIYKPLPQLCNSCRVHCCSSLRNQPYYLSTHETN